MKISSYVLIELDTTPPKIDIYAPRYTTRSFENLITIESNDILDSFQEIYVIDSLGNRHDYTFLRQERRLFGTVKFNSLPLGTVTLFAKIKDDVGNESVLYQTRIELKENLSTLKLETSESVREINIQISCRNITFETLTRNIEMESSSRNIGLNTNTRNIASTIEDLG